MVYDLLGGEVAQLVNETQSTGIYQVRFDGTGLSSGVYLYSIQAGEYTQSKNLMFRR